MWEHCISDRRTPQKQARKWSLLGKDFLIIRSVFRQVCLGLWGVVCVCKSTRGFGKCGAAGKGSEWHVLSGGPRAAAVSLAP